MNCKIIILTLLKKQPAVQSSLSVGRNFPSSTYTSYMCEEETKRPPEGAVSEAHDTELTSALPVVLAPPVTGTGEDKLAIPFRNVQSKTGAPYKSIIFWKHFQQFATEAPPWVSACNARRCPSMGWTWVTSPIVANSAT